MGKLFGTRPDGQRFNCVNAVARGAPVSPVSFRRESGLTQDREHLAPRPLPQQTTSCVCESATGLGRGWRVEKFTLELVLPHLFTPVRPTRPRSPVLFGSSTQTEKPFVRRQS